MWLERGRRQGRKRKQKAQGSNSQRVRQEARRAEAGREEGKGKEGTRVITRAHRPRPKNSFFSGKLWRKRRERIVEETKKNGKVDLRKRGLEKNKKLRKFRLEGKIRNKMQWVE